MARGLSKKVADEHKQRHSELRVETPSILSVITLSYFVIQFIDTTHVHMLQPPSLSLSVHLSLSLAPPNHTWHAHTTKNLILSQFDLIIISWAQPTNQASGLIPTHHPSHLLVPLHVPRVDCQYCPGSPRRLADLVMQDSGDRLCSLKGPPPCVCICNHENPGERRGGGLNLTSSKDRITARPFFSLSFFSETCPRGKRLTRQARDKWSPLP